MPDAGLANEAWTEGATAAVMRALGGVVVVESRGAVF